MLGWFWHARPVKISSSARVDCAVDHRPSTPEHWAPDSAHQAMHFHDNARFFAPEAPDLRPRPSAFDPEWDRACIRSQTQRLRPHTLRMHAIVRFPIAISGHQKSSRPPPFAANRRDPRRLPTNVNETRILQIVRKQRLMKDCAMHHMPAG